MNFQEFRGHFKEFGVFSTQDIRKRDADFDSRRLVEWQQKGYLKKIINRWYILSETEWGEQLGFYTSNRIYNPSYVSLESAFAYYGLIPEAVYTVTSVTSLKSNQFNTPVGTYSYRHLKPELMFGYRLVKTANKTFKIAEPEKLILDYFYLHPQFIEADDFQSLRINPIEIRSLIDEKKLYEYLELFNSNALKKRTAIFLNLVYAER